jgi:hypothetical protein
LYSPLPVPHTEKNWFSAAVKGLLSSTGIQYLQQNVKSEQFDRAHTISHAIDPPDWSVESAL